MISKVSEEVQYWADVKIIRRIKKLEIDSKILTNVIKQLRKNGWSSLIDFVDNKMDKCQWDFREALIEYGKTK